MLGHWLTLVVVLLQGRVPERAPGSELTLTTVQFYRDRVTLVNGFLEVPHRILGGVVLGPGGEAAYRVAIDVVDSAGTVLVHNSWTRTVGWQALRVPGSSSVESIAFTVAPGSYQLRVIVHDSATAHEATATAPLLAYTARPRASDLLLAYGIRRAGQAGDTVPAAGEIRKGELLIATAPEIQLPPTEARVFYYAEVYQDSAGAVPWALRARDSTGRVVLATPEGTATVATGGGSLAGSIDLTGLPPGGYELALRIGGPDSLTRTAAFRVGGFGLAGRLAEAGAAGGTGAEVADVFEQATEAQLDTLFAPLGYVPGAGELRVYQGLTLDGKRRFLRDFWRRRDPSPGTPANEAQAAFYQRIAEANRRFREGGAAEVPGWRTDRGRIFVRYGEPDDALHRPQTGPDLPWEVWKYSKDRALKFVFLDRTRLGNYALIFTNDRTEPSLPDWTALLSRDAIAEIANF